MQTKRGRVKERKRRAEKEGKSEGEAEKSRQSIERVKEKSRGREKQRKRGAEEERSKEREGQTNKKRMRKDPPHLKKKTQQTSRVKIVLNIVLSQSSFETTFTDKTKQLYSGSNQIF